MHQCRFSKDYINVLFIQDITDGYISNSFFAIEDAEGRVLIEEIPFSGSGILDDKIRIRLDNDYFNLGKYYSNVRIYDLNNNSIDEIFMFQTSGVGFYFQIIELNNEGINITFSNTPNYTFAYPFQFLEEKSFRFYPYMQTKVKDDGSPTMIQYEDYKWDTNTQKYLKYETGEVEVEWNSQDRLFYPISGDSH